MERKADPLRSRVARWLARTELRIDVQASAPAAGCQEGEFPPPLDDRRMLSELVGVIALAKLYAREETLAQRTMTHGRPAPAPRSTAWDPGFPDDLFPERWRGVSIPEEFLAGLMTRI